MTALPPAAHVSDAGDTPGLLTRLRSRRPGGSIAMILFYELGRITVLTFATLLFRHRCYGASRFPLGAVLVAANHQSYFDPPMIGAAVRNRQLDYLAADKLFAFGPWNWLMRALNAIPLKEGGDTGAMRTVLRRLGEGGSVLIFPEGGRSVGARMEPLKRGVAVVVKRAQCPVVPVAIEGFHEAWPKGQLFPSFFGSRVAVAFGRPIPHEELLAMDPQAALDRIGDEIDSMRMALRRRLRRESRGRFPPPGTGDLPRMR